MYILHLALIYSVSDADSVVIVVDGNGLAALFRNLMVLSPTLGLPNFEFRPMGPLNYIVRGMGVK